MRTIVRLTTALALLAIAVVISGCASARQPNYQRHTGASPTVHDYYPSNPK